MQAVVVSGLICAVALWKQALTKDGAAAAFVCGVCAVLAGWRHTAVLLAFFVTSSAATRISHRCSTYKRRANDDSRGRRWTQVVGSGGVATALAAAHAALLGPGNDSSLLVFWQQQSQPQSRQVEHSVLFASYVAAFAFGAADTWAAELGMLSSAAPRLITQPLRMVPRGTNGGVTLLGTLASACGGFVVGLAACACAPWQSLLPVLGLLVGLLGSAVDSVIGATLQRTSVDSATGAVLSDVDSNTKQCNTVVHVSGRPVLSNTQVNFVVSLICAVVTPITLLLLARWY